MDCFYFPSSHVTRRLFFLGITTIVFCTMALCADVSTLLNDFGLMVVILESMDSRVTFDILYLMIIHKETF